MTTLPAIPASAPAPSRIAALSLLICMVACGGAETLVSRDPRRSDGDGPGSDPPSVYDPGEPAPDEPDPGHPVGGYLECDGSSGVRMDAPGLLDHAPALTMELLVRVDSGTPSQTLVEIRAPGSAVDFFKLLLVPHPRIFHEEGFPDDARLLMTQSTWFDPRTQDWIMALPRGSEEFGEVTTRLRRWTHVAVVWDLVTFEQDVFFDGQRPYVVQTPLYPYRLDKEAVEICAGLSHGVGFVGAIDELRFSRTARYTDEFEPGPVRLDDDTLLLMHFDDLTEEARNLPVTVTGRPRIVREPPPAPAPAPRAASAPAPPSPAR